MDALCEDAGEVDNERELFMGYWKITYERVQALEVALKKLHEVSTNAPDIEIAIHCEKVLVDMLKALRYSIRTEGEE